MVVGEGLQTYSALYPTVLSRQASGLAGVLSGIIVYNGSTLRVSAGASVNGTSRMTCNGTGSITFASGSTFTPSLTGLNVSGCQATLSGNVSYVPSMLLANKSQLSLSSTLTGTTAGASTVTGTLVIGQLVLKGRSNIHGTFYRSSAVPSPPPQCFHPNIPTLSREQAPRSLSRPQTSASTRPRPSTPTPSASREGHQA